MKQKFIYFLPFMLVVLMVSAGCLKHNDEVDNTLPVPSGTFSGTFKVLHINTQHSGYDTTQRVNITLTMDVNTGYKVLSDTTTIHAGSYGGFILDAYNIQFADQTLSSTGTAPNDKIHLDGIYQYGYNGSRLQMVKGFADTLGYVYDLTKQ